MSRADKDGTGSLDVIEFLGMMRDKIKEESKESEINEAFKVFDTVRVPLVLTCSLSKICRMEMVTSTERSWVT